jgi:uncharacterized protein (TIGR03118 family)
VLKKTAVTVLALIAGAVAANAQSNANAYIRTNLVGNTTGLAPLVDPNMDDPWGISFSAASPFWVSDHFTGLATIYNGAGAINATVVKIPPGAASPAGSLGRPTGQAKPSTGFVIPAPNGKAASFIFATEDGTISAWNGGTTAVITVDNSAAKAVYKGLVVGTSANGPTLYAPNFRSGKIDVFDTNWNPVMLAGTFTDSAVPAGYAPFNIRLLTVSGVTNLYVAYAKQDANQFLDVAGPGNGYVSVFDQNGNLVSHLIDDGIRRVFGTPVINSPWGMAIAPASWGAFGGDLLVGNFGDGRMNAFNPTTGVLLGTLRDTNGAPIAIAGLWTLIFGNGGSGGDVNTLYFTAGRPDGDITPRGILGSLAPPEAITGVFNAASELSGPVAPGELIKIVGQTVGPSPAITATIPPTAPASSLATTVSGTSATVNGTAAPILYTNGTQTNIQIPYEVAGATTANLVLTVGTQTAAFTATVAPTAPGLFTINFTGLGQAVALNADGTVNSSTNPAARGSNIWLFATGAGVTNPADADGTFESDTSRVPVAPLSVTINGQNATVGTDGSTPKDVSGVLELMVTIPAGIATTGSVPVLLTAGGVTTTQPTVIFIK